MEEQQLKKIISEQRKFFKDGNTLPVKGRIEALKRLKNTVKRHEDEICEALYKDLGKSKEESYMCEIGMVYSEIDHMIKHIADFSKERQVRTPLAQAFGRSFVKMSPKGNILIMSPWNYPFMLSLEPLVDAIAAGNTVIVKPSAYAPFTSQIVELVVNEAMESFLAKVITGGRKENQRLLDEKFDHIFFTGSQSVGKEVLRKASENLTPVTLELGGKSPCIVDSSANIPLAARRIVFGKFLNCGQTCVAPDYILCEEKVKDALLKELVREIKRQFGLNPLENPKYGHIVNEKHFDRLCSILEREKVFYGGKQDREALKIEPAIIYPVSWDGGSMKEEIFGPILPVITFKSLDDVIAKVGERPHPLALYIFSKNKKNIEILKSRILFGGGCINDTIIHLATPYMGFGGIGASGMGAYHGKAGFDTFSHKKSMVDKKTFLDLPMRYQPYTKLNYKLIRIFLK